MKRISGHVLLIRELRVNQHYLTIYKCFILFFFSDNRSRNNSSLTPLPKILPNHTEVIEFNGHENGRNDFEMAEMVTMLQTKTNSHQDTIETIVSVNH